jgi:peptidyl-tRNA hydrolase
MEKDLDTGVEDSRAAAENDVETGEADETTPSQPEDDTTEEYDIASYFGEEDSEKVVESGDDNPPNDSETEEEPAQGQKPADYYRSQAEVDAAVQKRLQQARKTWEKEQSDKIAVDAEVDKQAAKYIEDHPDMNLPPEMVKAFIKTQQPAKPAQRETSSEDAKQQAFDAWKQSLTDEEPLLKIETANPDFTVSGYATDNPTFKTALSMGLTPMAAYKVTKAFEVQQKAAIEKAKAEGGKKVIDQIKSSNARATTPATATKSTGRTQSIADRIANMTEDEFDEFNSEILRHGRRVRVD